MSFNEWLHTKELRKILSLFMEGGIAFILFTLQSSVVINSQYKTCICPTSPVGKQREKILTTR